MKDIQVITQTLYQPTLLENDIMGSWVQRIQLIPGASPRYVPFWWNWTTTTLSTHQYQRGHTVQKENQRRLRLNVYYTPSIPSEWTSCMPEDESLHMAHTITRVGGLNPQNVLCTLVILSSHQTKHQTAGSADYAGMVIKGWQKYIPYTSGTLCMGASPPATLTYVIYSQRLVTLTCGTRTCAFNE